MSESKNEEEREFFMEKLLKGFRDEKDELPVTASAESKW